MKKGSNNITIWILIVLIVGSWCAVGYETYRIGRMNMPILSRLWNLRHYGPFTAADVHLIAPWMTFDYINVVFQISPSYLEYNLQITDPQYPRLTIAHYTKIHHLNQTVITDKIQILVSTYLTTKQPSQ